MQKVQIQLASSPQTSHSQTGASFWLKRRTLWLPMRPWRSSLIYHTQLQLGGSAEVVGVLKTAAFAQDLAKLDLHGAFAGTCEHAKRPIPVRIGNRISGPIDVEITEVAAAFQPFSPQEVVQLFEGGVGSHLHIHPENGRVGVLDPHTKEPCDLSAGRFVLGQAAPKVA